jgi:4-amino-4-deoxyprephenate dehydrogenase
MIEKVVVLGGLGEVGTLLSRSLAASGAAVLDVDRRPPPGPPAGAAPRPFLAADAAAPGGALGEALAAADAVAVCLPEEAALAALDGVVGAMARGALWIDTLSVKTAVCRALAARAPGIEALSINPMFAPALGWRGNAVATVEVAAGPRSAALLDLIGAWGARVERLSAAEHDALTAATQVATHAAVLAFGAALLELGYDAQAALRLATPPHRLMLALLSRVIHANPTVYAEIQRYHPQGEAVRQAMGRALAALSESAQDPGAALLRRWFDELALLLAPARGALRELGDRLVAQAAGELPDVET